MSKMDKRLQELERKQYPVLTFNDMYDEEKIQAYEKRFGKNPYVKSFNDMYDGSEKAGFKPTYPWQK